MKVTRRRLPRGLGRALRDVDRLPTTDMYDVEAATMLAEARRRDDAADWMLLHRHLYNQAVARTRAVHRAAS